MKTIIGIDWSQKKHNVYVQNEQGKCLLRFEIQHTADGFGLLRQRLSQLQPIPSHCLIAIETGYNLLVDFLVEQGYPVYVIPPTTVDGNRTRLGQAGAKDDDRDAHLLAEILRTDRPHLIPWSRPNVLVAELKQTCSWIDDLTLSINQNINRLRQNLNRYYPQALAAFSDFTTEIALKFIIAFPSPDKLADLDYGQWVTFCQDSGYSRKSAYPKRFAHLKQTAFNVDSLNLIYAQHTAYLASTLLELCQTKKQLVKQTYALFQQHPDAFIFESIPGSGAILAPKLLAFFGDDRSRYPSSSILQAVAGTAPVTKQSGSARYVRFRYGCNHQFRQTMQQLAKASVEQSPWAYTYYIQAFARSKSKNHAYRCLANRWVHIIWTLWQRRQPYDVSSHLQHIQLELKPVS